MTGLFYLSPPLTRSPSAPTHRMTTTVRYMAEIGPSTCRTGLLQVPHSGSTSVVPNDSCAHQGYDSLCGITDNHQSYLAQRVLSPPLGPVSVLSPILEAFSQASFSPNTPKAVLPCSLVSSRLDLLLLFTCLWDVLTRMHTPVIANRDVWLLPTTYPPPSI